VSTRAVRTPEARIDGDGAVETTMKSIERTTAETLMLLETLQANAPIGFGFVDRDFRFVRLNERLAATNGLTVKRQLGRTVADVLPDIWP
jgi:PAS domain-containing protein